MQIQEAEQGDLGTSDALLVSREWGDSGFLVFVVAGGDLAAGVYRVGVGSLMEQVLSGLVTAFSSVSVFRDGATTAGVESAFRVLREVSPWPSKRGRDSGCSVEAGFVTDKVWPVDARGFSSRSIEGQAHVSGWGHRGF